MSLRDRELEFFRALGTESDVPEGTRGRFEVYRYAYFERIRASVEEDYPELFEYLDSLPEGAIDAEAVTRDLLVRNHPRSWTLAEASLPVMASVDALLPGPAFAEARREARRRAARDEAESLAGWVEEWPEAPGEKAARVSDFAAAKLRLARTKTWHLAEGTVYWRADSGVVSAELATFREFEALLPLVETPIAFAALVEHAEKLGDPKRVTAFLQRGIAEGWLRLVA
ncbi:MAG: hypothetical protein JST04_13490 [Bdellovibrionales bacterium]|nr:hypothetical protein [Bdellovibrionales bacterium]